MNNRKRRKKRQASGVQAPTSLWVRRGPGREERISQLVSQMQQGVREGTAVDLAVPSHVETTEALHRMVFDTSAGDVAALKVKIGDVALGDFPVYAVWSDEPAESQDEGPSPLRIGTLTLRHVDYDKHVDRYLIRDNETRRRSSSAIARLAHERMSEILDDRSFRDGGTIDVFQTGLESLVVGMYLGLTEHLMRRVADGLPPLRIRPIFHTDFHRDATGRVWASPEMKR